MTTCVWRTNGTGCCRAGLTVVQFWLATDDAEVLAMVWEASPHQPEAEDPAVPRLAPDDAMTTPSITSRETDSLAEMLPRTLECKRG